MRLIKAIIILWAAMYAELSMAQQNPSPDLAKQWLQTSLHYYFTDSLNILELTTPRYAEFKKDAIGISFDGGTSREIFEKKWGEIYNVKEPSVSNGFFIPLQDWNHIAMECQFIYAHKQTLWFRLGLRETTTGAYFGRYVKLLPVKGNFRIDDVLENVTRQEYVTGDFNGDRKNDTLAVAFISETDKRPIEIDTTLSYDSLITAVINKKPSLQLIASGFNVLLLNPDNFYVLGLELLKNIGNINKIPGDEIAVILSAADWSAINVCSIYSYNKHSWKRIKSVEIREEDIHKIESGKIKPWNK